MISCLSVLPNPSNAFAASTPSPPIPFLRQVPEINAHAIGSSRLIANPNCTTAIAVMPLWPLHQQFGVRRLIMSTYQAASGAGAEVGLCLCMPLSPSAL